MTFGPEMGSNELLVTAMLRDELSPGLGVVRKELAGVADAQTEVAATSKAASAGLDRTAASAEGASRKLTAAELSGRNAAGQFRTLGLSLPKTAAALAITAAGAVYLAQRFESAMTRVNTQAGASLAEVHKLGGELLRMAPSVGITPDKLAESLYHVESAGFRGAAALDAVRASAHGAAIGNANLEDVTQAMIASLASGIGGVHGADDAMALLNRTVGIGDMRMQGLARALATGILPSARSAGLQFEDVAAALATITDNATPADEAATRLRMTFALMSSPSAKAAAALGTIGMKSTTLAEDMRKPHGLLVALTDLQAHLAASGKTAVQQNQVLEHAFGGGRTSGAILTLLAEMDRLRSKYAELGDAAQRQAEFQAAWATYTDTLSYKWHSLVAGLEAGGITIGQRLMPAAKDLLDVLLATGSAVGTVVAFFDRNRVVLMLLAAVITGLLLPALARTVVSLGAIAAEKTVMGLWNLSMGASALVGSLSMVSLGFAAVAAAGVFAWSQNRAMAADAKKQADAYVASLNASTTSLSSIERAAAGISKEIALGSQKATGRPTLVRAGGPIQEDINAAGMPTTTINGKTFTEVITDTGELAKQRDKLLSQAAAMRTNEADLGSAYNLSGIQVEALAKRYGVDLTGALSVVGPKFDDVMKSIALSHDPAARAAADVAALADSSTAAADAVTALKDSLDALIGNAISADEAAITFRDRIVDLSKALKTSHGSMGLASASGRVARQSFDEAASSVTQWVTAVQQSTNSVPATAAALKTAIDMLAPYAAHNDYAAQKVRALRHELDLLQGRIDTLHGKDITVGVHAPGLRGSGRVPIAGDTVGPRASRLADAMSFHARVSAGVPGKRFVSSHMRSWGLGSPDSDHATGRAYDLVGPNLGAYAAAARRAGGFAEFHGAGPGRHLHVAAGDTPGPRGGGPSSGDGVSVAVHVAPGAIVIANPRDDAEIAAAVEEGMARGVQRGIERARVPASTWGAH